MTEKTNNVGNKYDFVVKEILHENHWCYRALRGLQEATEFKGKIPKSHYYKYDDYNFAHYFEIGETKAEARSARDELVNLIANVIKSHTTYHGEKMLHDHYARLFHALAILKVDKGTDLVPSTTKDNLVYNSMYVLWRADDGSDNAERGILRAAWYLSEEYKRLTEGYTPDCIAGCKC